jgi:hypothetical protein
MGRQHVAQALIGANDVIEQQLDGHAGALETEVKSDVLALFSPLLFGLEKLVRDLVEGHPARNEDGRLMVLVETAGGTATVVERIVRVLRKHYEHVEFLIPSHAMSAGTILVMSGDSIHMDYFSVLGPIDPQLEREGAMVPALGYIEKYNELVAKSLAGKLSAAEVVYLVQRFDPADMHRYEQERELTISMLKEWLVKYKFASWKTTRTRRKRVTQQMRTFRAGQIARNLNDTKRWHSHSRGISMDVLRKDLKLEIEDFGADPDLARLVRDYHVLLSDYMAKLGNRGILHIRGNCVKIAG